MFLSLWSNICLPRNSLVIISLCLLFFSFTSTRKYSKCLTRSKVSSPTQKACPWPLSVPKHHCMICLVSFIDTQKEGYIEWYANHTTPCSKRPKTYPWCSEKICVFQNYSNYPFEQARNQRNGSMESRPPTIKILRFLGKKLDGVFSVLLH